uniref:Uncharacterized protein n=1 Tax=Coccidioides posadasii RMSCC 3488 TaxID=454284 RepID=A0A0J6FEG0_COCPO|nr:hypothetical protein CPAG_03624 [Coccidioides posadasii RMSCC 3488]
MFLISEWKYNAGSNSIPNGYRPLLLGKGGSLGIAIPGAFGCHEADTICRIISTDGRDNSIVGANACTTLVRFPKPLPLLCEAKVHASYEHPLYGWWLPKCRSQEAVKELLP